VHWFTTPQLSRVLRDAGLEVFSRLDLMRPEQMTGARAFLRWMAPRDGRPARGRLLYYLGASTISLYARRPAL
jgi:hypothetical protein